MDIQPDFSRYYKRLSNAELLEILENPVAYQAAALEAAEKELSNRQLSDAEVETLKNDRLENQLLIIEKEQKKKAFQDKMEYNGNSIIASINPDQEGISNNERSIRIIVISLGILFLYQLIRDLTIIRFIIKDMADMPVETISIILPIILLPAALYLFWKRRITGWRLLVIWLTYFIVNNGGLLLSSSFSNSKDYFYQTPSIPGILVNLTILCGALYTICKTNIRVEFNIEKNDMASTIALTAVLTLIFFWMVS